MLAENVKTATIVVPHDLAGSSIESFKDELELILKTDPCKIHLDSTGLKNVNSSHIGLLWGSYCLCREHGVTPSLKSPTPELIQVLKVLDLYDVLVAPSGTGGTEPGLRKAALIGLPRTAQTYVDEFRPTSEAIDEAMTGFLRFLRHLELPDITEFELRTVFYEWATNIRNHSQIGEDERVVFTACTSPSKITMAFADSGVPFDPTTIGPALSAVDAAEILQKHGFGLSMIRKMTDNMRYIRQDDVINVLTLDKNRSH